MKFVVIFAEDNPVLFALKKVGSTDVFTKIFKDWNNPSYLWNYIDKNKEDLGKRGNDEGELIDSAGEIIIGQAEQLNLKIYRLAKNYIDNTDGAKLDSLFKKLHTSDDDVMELRPSKAKGSDGPDWLRIYAIRIEANCYLITGGLIKFTDTMQGSSYGKTELQVIKRVKDFLKSKNINTKQNLIDYING